MSDKKDSRRLIYTLAVWAGGIGFLVSLLYLGYMFWRGNQPGALDYLNLPITMFAYIYFRNELRKINS
ncbi:hypothetical protein BHU72_10840 [Desulfuribacillus stibiiarsenatis]|uniref:Uncharacterized protein n=1 Tax=Desulfuribacillus stibiiarsenatis TaxID=1390249 RepID=A0A1E5L2B8_9FIRM|nr:hypothetical protein [Desulfuribacillus stibiiarsenatis]OEH84302.1 hypothetical protein BHU72_10840 [Desulfuribacillus stibiiarsenatis]